ncbi:MAG: LysM peptidoglycan-binding domain-containing protein [Saprospiraceae bacterium]|nr:LysM peptidoglycan-binding domain-containing protein [Saprospiraceae bacterium]
MRFMAFFLLFLCLSEPSFSHTEPQFSLLEVDSVVVDVTDDQQVFFLHKMEPKQTLYSTARLYDVDLNDIYLSNPELIDRIVRKGETIRIPVKNWHIDPESQQGPLVYYQVKPKETLFRVARIYFDLTVDQVKSRNALAGNELDIGQLLNIGRLVRTGDSEMNNSFSVDSANLSELMPDFTGQSWVEDKNIAYWLKEANPDHSHVVLHDEAPVNSWVAITNPMYGKTVTAKVIGRIPNNVYPSDIDVILSHGVAESLGAIDARFYVKLKHLKRPTHP